MSTRDVVAATAAALLIAGCASSPSQKIINDEPPATRWTGSMQATQQRTGELAVTTQNRASGSITIGSPTGSGVMQRVHVSLIVSIPLLAANQLRWAVLPNRCGSADLPIIGFEQFPLLDIGTNGRGEVQADLPLELVANSAYHVNVYNGGQQLENVFTCGNLRYEAH